MNWFMNLKIRSKLFVGFSIVLLIMVSLSINNYFGIEKIREFSNNMHNVSEEMEDLSKGSISDILYAESRASEYFITDDKEDFENFKKAVNNSLDKLNKLIVITEKDKEHLATVKNVIEDYETYKNKYLSLIEQIEQERIKSKHLSIANIIEAKPSIKAEWENIDSYIENGNIHLNELIEQIDVDLEKEYADIEKQLVNMQRSIIIFSIIALIIALILIVSLANSISKPLKEILNNANEISKGNVDTIITVNTNDELGDLARAFKQMSKNIKLLVVESNYLVKAVIDGKLSVRADVSKHNGDFAKIISELNNAVDAIVNPMNESVAVLEKMSQGDFSTKVVGKYQGDHTIIKNSVNVTIDSVNKVLSDIDNIIKEATNGNLKYRTDHTKYQGDFAKIIKGINNTIDTILEPINESIIVLEKMAKGDFSAKVIGKYQGEHTAIKDSVNITIEFINKVLSDIDNIIKEATN